MSKNQCGLCESYEGQGDWGYCTYYQTGVSGYECKPCFVPADLVVCSNRQERPDSLHGVPQAEPMPNRPEEPRP